MSLKRTNDIKNNHLYNEVKTYSLIKIEDTELRPHIISMNTNNFYDFDSQFRRKSIINTPFFRKSNMAKINVDYDNNKNNLTLTEVFNFKINNTSTEHIAFLNLGLYHINPKCEINNRLLKALKCSCINIEIEEFKSVFTRLFIFVSETRNSKERDNIISTSLDFKNNDIFINGLKEYVYHYLNQDLTIEYIKENLIECIEQIEVTNY